MAAALKIINTHTILSTIHENYKPVGEPWRISRSPMVNMSEQDDEPAGSTKAVNLFTSRVIIEF